MAAEAVCRKSFPESLMTDVGNKPEPRKSPNIKVAQEQALEAAHEKGQK